MKVLHPRSWTFPSISHLARPWHLPAALATLVPGLHGQVLITRWDFNDASLLPRSGMGEARTVGGTSGTFAAGHDGESSGAWNLKGFPVQGALPGTAGVEFGLSTEDHGAVSLAFQIRHSNTSANTERVLWSSDGVRFTEAGRFTVTPAATGAGETWYDRTVSLPPEAGRQAWLQVRVVSDFGDSPGDRYTATRLGSGYSTAGTWRLDNVTFSAVPEPEESAAISALGLLGFALWHRGRRREPDADANTDRSGPATKTFPPGVFRTDPRRRTPARGSPEE